jgi:hypothetical protein
MHLRAATARPAPLETTDWKLPPWLCPAELASFGPILGAVRKPRAPGFVLPNHRGRFSKMASRKPADAPAGLNLTWVSAALYKPASPVTGLAE